MVVMSEIGRNGWMRVVVSIKLGGGGGGDGRRMWRGGRKMMHLVERVRRNVGWSVRVAVCRWQAAWRRH